MCWISPPYGNRALGEWVRKAYEAAQQGAVVVALLPMFTDTKWFHDFGSHATIEVLKGRLRSSVGLRTDTRHSDMGFSCSEEVRQGEQPIGDQPCRTPDRHPACAGRECCPTQQQTNVASPFVGVL